MQITINELLVLNRSVRERINELRQLRSEVSKSERFYGATEKVTEPKYDVKLVDKKVTELEKFIFKSDSAIKRSNAVTEVSIDVDVETLLDPIQ